MTATPTEVPPNRGRIMSAELSWRVRTTIGDVEASPARALLDAHEELTVQIHVAARTTYYPGPLNPGPLFALHRHQGRVRGEILRRIEGARDPIG